MLETARLRLRRWKDSDREPFAALNADPQVMRYFPACLSRAESDAMVDRIERHFGQHGFGMFAVELKEVRQFVGYVGLVRVSFDAPFVPAVEMGWRLAAAYWNKGFATEAAREVVRYSFRDLGLTDIVAFTVPGNVPSRRVMEKLGMSHDPTDDFEHPRVPIGHPLRFNVLYRLTRLPILQR
jgi:RimJ/RimL family protein N-acetyltransferase